MNYLKNHKKAGGTALREALTGRYRYQKACTRCLAPTEEAKDSDKLILYNGLKSETNFRDLLKKTLTFTDKGHCGQPGCCSSNIKNSTTVLMKPELLAIGVYKFNKITGNKKSQKVSMSLILDLNLGGAPYSLVGFIEHKGGDSKYFGGYRSLVQLENK